MKLKFGLFLILFATAFASRDAAAQITLDQQAAASIDQGAVTIYQTVETNGSNARRCAESFPANDTFGSPYLGFFDCNFTPPQKFLLLRTGQVALQSNPMQCLAWQLYLGTGAPLTTAGCQVSPDSTQSFVFHSNGAISTLDGSDCLATGDFGYGEANGGNAGSEPCSGTDSSQLWTIQSDPTVLYRINDVTYSTAQGSEQDIIVQNSSTSANAAIGLGNAQQSPTLTSFWFVTPVPYAAASQNLYYVQNADTGYCLTMQTPETIYGTVVATPLYSSPCNIQGSDQGQTWSFSNWNPNGPASTLSGWNPQTQAYTSSQTYLVSTTFGVPITVPGITQYGDVLEVYPAPGLLNTILVTANPNNPNDNGLSLLPQGYLGANCLEPSGSSNLEISACTVLSDAYASAVDVLPDTTIRFRSTGNCLNLSSSQNTASQSACNTAPTAAASAQKWIEQNADYFNPFTWPLYTALNLTPSAAEGAWLSSSISQGQLALADGVFSPWVFNAANDVNACVDTAQGLSQNAPLTGSAARTQLEQLFNSTINALQSLNSYSTTFSLTNAVYNLQAMNRQLRVINLNSSSSIQQIAAAVQIARTAVAEWEVGAAQVGYTPGPASVLSSIESNLGAIESQLGTTPRCLMNLTAPFTQN
jgi:hypothetical protein